MRISYLELKNYRRFRQLKLQFPDGITGILGMNGVGKTTIIEAIAWTLFGNVDEVVRTSREGVRRVGASPADSCLAILEFELGGSEYRIEREMSGRSLHMRAVLRTKDKILAEGDRPVRTMVEKLLGMDSKSFFTSVFARQKELNALQNVAPGERKKVILRMLRIDSIDSAISSIRADKNQIHSKIEGSERTILMEDGREKEKVLNVRLPELSETLDRATCELSIAQAEEREIARSVEETRKRREELKKDVEAYNATQGDLRAKLSTVEELERRKESLSVRMGKERPRLDSLPALTKDEDDWKKVTARRDELQIEKEIWDRAKSLSEGIAEDELDMQKRAQELSSLKKAVNDAGDFQSKIVENDQLKDQSDHERKRLQTEEGRLRAVIGRSLELIEKETKKLQDIESAGPEGDCPTCEQQLAGAYDKLVKRLTNDLDKMRAEGVEAQKELEKVEGEMKALAKKEEALKKKRAWIDQERTRTEKLRATVTARESETGNIEARLGKKRKDLASLGKVKFKPEEYARVQAEHERLKRAHDEYLNLKNLEQQVHHLERDLTETKEKIEKESAVAEKYRGLIQVLEPKKNAYDSVVHELDAKNASLVSAKDRVGGLLGDREKACAALDKIKEELAEIERIKKAIEQDRKLEEDLGDLEGVIVEFRTDLISRIAPALAALTSKGLEAMTEGRYPRVELDENYEMQLDDQGTLYPVGRFSGGESDLANLCLRLAISGIIADRTGANPINILILDEIFGSLDPSRKRSVMSALTRLSGQFRQVFLITHIEDVKDLMDNIIRVQELEDGSSTAELLAS